jgi:hypothetical protein
VVRSSSRLPNASARAAVVATRLPRDRRPLGKARFAYVRRVRSRIARPRSTTRRTRPADRPAMATYVRETSASMPAAQAHHPTRAPRRSPGRRCRAPRRGIGGASTTTARKADARPPATGRRSVARRVRAATRQRRGATRKARGGQCKARRSTSEATVPRHAIHVNGAHIVDRRDQDLLGGRARFRGRCDEL